MLVYGGVKNYLGHSKHYHDNLVVFPDGDRLDPPGTLTQAEAVGPSPYCASYAAPVHNQSGYDEYFYSNICVMQKSGRVYYFDRCNTGDLADMVAWTHNNTFFLPPATLFIASCQRDEQNSNFTLAEWQAYQQEAASTESRSPSMQDILVIARRVVGLDLAD